ncbi:MAG: DUF2470 domain-containing protein [Acidimicrobiales bacterium]
MSFDDVALDPDALVAIRRHMNADHAADCLDIVRHLGPYPDATAAELVSLDAVGSGFLVTLPDGIATVHIPWRGPIRARADIRHEFVAMCDDARSA